MIGRTQVFMAMLAGVGALALTFGRGALPLYVWNASASVPVGLYWQSADSLDSRYFGPISASAVIGRAHPVWIERED
jgi:type IV secretory pathway protease TraF